MLGEAGEVTNTFYFKKYTRAENILQRNRKFA